MSALRIAFLSSLVLELAAALATALVAVEVGLRLLAGHVGYETALLVLLLTPEAYLPLRNLGAQFHASAEGTTAAGRVFEILDSPMPNTTSAGRCTRPVERADRAARRHAGLPRPAGSSASRRHCRRSARASASRFAGRAEPGRAPYSACCCASPSRRRVRSGRRHRPCRHRRGPLATPDRVGAAKPVPVRRNRRREHRARRCGRHARRHRPGRQPGRSRGIYQVTRRRLRHQARRARAYPVGGPAAADSAGPGILARRATGAAGRADRAPRPGNGRSRSWPSSRR